jgi:hypothetical protein
MTMTTTATPVEACQGMLPRIQIAHREHDGCGHAGPHGGEDHLLHRHRADGKRGQQPVLDLVAVGELDDQRKGSALQPGEDRGQGHQAGEEDLFVAGPGVPELGEHLAEDEQQEERLEDHLGQEDRELATGDEQVASQDGHERSSRSPVGEAARGRGRPGLLDALAATVIGGPFRSGG